MSLKLIRPLFAVGLVLCLAACSATPTPSQPDPTVSASESAEPSSHPETGVSPDSCDLEEVIAAFNERLDGAIFIPTDWQPAEGTDLYDAYEAGGIACTYGIESAEIGGTVMWAPASDELWLEKSTEWKAAGYVGVDVPDVDEHEAFILETTSADGQAVWYINFHIGGVWVQFGASKFIASLDDALEIVQAAALVTMSN
jgi:hypothetical protein